MCVKVRVNGSRDIPTSYLQLPSGTRFEVGVDESLYVLSERELLDVASGRLTAVRLARWLSRDDTV